jgi:hypothetical protein
MPPSRRLSLREPPELCSGEGEDPAPPLTPAGEARGTDAHAGGRRATRLCRRLMAAGLAGVHHLHLAAPTIRDAGSGNRRKSARELVRSTLSRRLPPPRRDEGRGPPPRRRVAVAAPSGRAVVAISRERKEREVGERMKLGFDLGGRFCLNRRDSRPSISIQRPALTRDEDGPN